MSSFATFTAPYEGVSRRRACGRCHARKVRCDFNNSDGPCTNCIASGDRCELQMRKRRTPRRPVQHRPDPAAHLELDDSVQDASTLEEPSFSSPPSLHSLDHTISGFGARRSSSVTTTHEATPRALQPSSAMASPSARRVRAASFVNRGAILPDAISGLDKETEQQEHSISEVDLKVLELYRAFDMPPRAVRQSLVDAFFEHCWTWMPVLDPDQSISESKSYLLLQALFVAGSQMRFNGSRYASTEEYLRRVKALLDANYEKDPLTLLAALCIIQWWNPSAPNVVSTTTSRFWVMYGVNIAQQIGLHRKAPEGTSTIGLRRRIWWTLYARDCLVSSAHGRPRAINLADCTIEPPQPSDFSQPIDQRATIFCFYVSICGILGDLCESVSRKSTLSPADRKRLGEALVNWLNTLPESVRLFDMNGRPKHYNFEVSRLHIPFFTAVMILFRPPSIFWYHSSCAAAVIASRMACQIFECFLLRDQVHYLNGAYSWQLLVTAIPQLSCATVPGLNGEAESLLNGLEDVLRALAQKLQSAANNLKNVQLLRVTLQRGGPSHSTIAKDSYVPDLHELDPAVIMKALRGPALHDYEHLLSLAPSDEANWNKSAVSITQDVRNPNTELDTSLLDADFTLEGVGSGEFTDPFTGQSDWILDLMNGLSSWR